VPVRQVWVSFSKGRQRRNPPVNEGMENQHTVPFHSIRRSCVTAPLKLTKCHGCPGSQRLVTKHFGQAPIKIPKKVGIGPVGDEILGMSRVPYGFDKNKISSEVSWVMGGDKLNEMRQYSSWEQEGGRRSEGGIRKNEIKGAGRGKRDSDSERLTVWSTVTVCLVSDPTLSAMRTRFHNSPYY